MASDLPPMAILAPKIFPKYTSKANAEMPILRFLSVFNILGVRFIGGINDRDPRHIVQRKGKLLMFGLTYTVALFCIQS